MSLSRGVSQAVFLERKWRWDVDELMTWLYNNNTILQKKWHKLVIKNFSKNCEDVGMQKMYGNKVGMEETWEYNLYIYTSLLIPISSGYWPRKLQSPLRESIIFSWYYVIQ